jgi:hypothetical protein
VVGIGLYIFERNFSAAGRNGANSPKLVNIQDCRETPLIVVHSDQPAGKVVLKHGLINKKDTKP